MTKRPLTELEVELLEEIRDRRRIVVVRFQWNQAARTGDPTPWPDSAIQWLFDGRTTTSRSGLKFGRPLRNWSVSGFWQASTLGVLDLTFDLFPKDGSSPLMLNAPRDSNRAGKPDQAAYPTAKAYLNSLNPPVDIDSYDGFIFWVDATTTDWGAIDEGPIVEGRGAATQRALLDQMLAHNEYAHEVGHVAGYEHTFDTSNMASPVYLDPYCVMANQGDNTFALPVDADVDKLDHGPNLWRGTRLASAASSFRCQPQFRECPSVIDANRGAVEEHRLVALSEAQFGDPVLVVIRDPGDVPLLRDEQPAFLVEYRTRTGWDRALEPAVIIHSRGYRANPPNYGEDRPVWREGTITTPWIDRYDAPDGRFAVEVVELSNDLESAVIRISR